MGVLEKISELKAQGLGDQEIVQKLRETGYSPKDIEDAMGQSAVKSAIYGEGEYPAKENSSNMQPSIMTQEINQQDTNIPIPPPEEIPAPEPQSPEYSSYPSSPYPQYPSYPQQGYQGYSSEYAPATMAMDNETISDIAEQIVDEKTSQLKNQIKDLVQINSLMKSKIENFDERLKRIENIIDELQLSIIKRIGTFGEDISNMRKEMSMFEDSFSKIINPFLDKARKETPRK